MTDCHPVKKETFNTTAMSNIDPKGFVRPVDRFYATDFGLYMARPCDHPRFGYLESWLLPDVGLRANIFHFRDGIDVHQDYYIDIVDITSDGSTWNTRDLYVDVVSVTGEPVDVLDIDELAAATSAGLISADDAEKAIDATLVAVDGITRNGDDAMAWLASRGMDLSWANPDEITLAPVGPGLS